MPTEIRHTPAPTEELSRGQRPSQGLGAPSHGLGQMPSCRTCRASIRPDRFYCYDCWTDLIDRLGDKIERIANDAAEIYIGRTCDPDARREEHFEDSRRGNLMVLYGSYDIDEVCAVEEALIREFAELPKLANATDESLGAGRPDLRNWVYVSWRRKQGRRMWTSWR